MEMMPRAGGKGYREARSIALQPWPWRHAGSFFDRDLLAVVVSDSHGRRSPMPSGLSELSLVPAGLRLLCAGSPI